MRREGVGLVLKPADCDARHRLSHVMMKWPCPHHNLDCRRFRYDARRSRMLVAALIFEMKKRLCALELLSRCPFMIIDEFLELTAGAKAGQWRMPVQRKLCGGRDSIFGGCALAAGIEVAERETGRPLIFATCQFLRPAHLSSVVTLSCVVSAAGRAVSHVRVIGDVDGEEVFVRLLSTGERHYPAQAIHAAMPRVPGPEGLPPRYILGARRGGIRDTLTELAVTDDPRGIMRSEDGRVAVWISLPGGIPGTASALALIGDEVSTGTSAVVDKDAQAPSIDNTLRVVNPQATDWVLADIEVRAIDNGFAHGIVNLWSREGQLLGIAEQTGALRIRGQ